MRISPFFHGHKKAPFLSHPRFVLGCVSETLILLSIRQHSLLSFNYKPSKCGGLRKAEGPVIPFLPVCESM